VGAWLYSLLTYLALVEIGLNAAPDVLETQKLLIASSFLTGYALLWYRAQAHTFKCFRDFEQALKRQFGDQLIATNSRHKLAGLRQVGSIAQYTASFNELALQISSEFMSSAEGFHAFMRGLQHDCRIHITLALRGEHDTAVAQQLAAEFESASRSLFGSGVERRRPARIHAMTGPDLSRVQCYNCDEYGHKQDTCTKPKRFKPPQNRFPQQNRRPPPPPKNGR
jgi:hypothetical protein